LRCHGGSRRKQCDGSIQNRRVGGDPLAIVGADLNMSVLLLRRIPASAISRVTNVVANLALQAARIAVMLRLVLISLLARRLNRLLAADPAGPA